MAAQSINRRPSRRRIPLLSRTVYAQFLSQRGARENDCPVDWHPRRAVGIELILRQSSSWKREYRGLGLENIGSLMSIERRIRYLETTCSTRNPAHYGPFSTNLRMCRTPWIAWLATQCRSHRSPSEFPANREFYRDSMDSGGGWGLWVK